jgi:hypothetical protein
MSHFYGTIKGSRGEATRCGSKGSGVSTVAASWGGAIKVVIWHDETTGEDKFTVRQIPWQGQGVGQLLASGVVGEKCRTSAAEQEVV